MHALLIKSYLFIFISLFDYLYSTITYKTNNACEKISVPPTYCGT